MKLFDFRCLISTNCQITLSDLQLCRLIRAKYNSSCTNHIWGNCNCSDKSSKSCSSTCSILETTIRCYNELRSELSNLLVLVTSSSTQTVFQITDFEAVIRTPTLRWTQLRYFCITLKTKVARFLFSAKNSFWLKDTWKMLFFNFYCEPWYFIQRFFSAIHCTPRHEKLKFFCYE